MIGLATHPSMPHCPPPPQCDPTDDVLVAPLEPGIADVGLVFLERAPGNIKPAEIAAPGTLERSEGARTTIVGGLTSPGRALGLPVDAWPWDGKRALGPRLYGGSSMTPGGSGRYRAMCAPEIQAVAFS